MEKENYSLMNIIILVILKEMGFMDMEELKYMILVFMKETSEIKKLLVMGFLNIPMGIFMKEIWTKVKKTDMGNSLLLMEKLMKENFQMIHLLEIII